MTSVDGSAEVQGDLLIGSLLTDYQSYCYAGEIVAVLAGGPCWFGAGNLVPLYLYSEIAT